MTDLNLCLADDEVDYERYLVAIYWLRSTTTLWDAAWNVAVGQSIGNPAVRNQWETDELIERHACRIITDDARALRAAHEGVVKIAFPVANLAWDSDGVSQLLCQLMGGQLDIELIAECHLLQVLYPSQALQNRPLMGLSGFRTYTGVHDRPLLGAIIKPKVGLSLDQLLDMVKQLVDGGVNFIKEDEIMSNPAVCPLEQRIPRIAQYVRDRRVVYAACINADPMHLLQRAARVVELGGNGIHVNVWSGLGAYNALRQQNLPLFIHFQRSGDRIFTNPRHAYHIRWPVICELAGRMGVDSIHAGMWGGYRVADPELPTVMRILWEHNVVPALSCGMHPGLVEDTRQEFGTEWMANVGGAIHGHPSGTQAGVRAMRQAIDRTYGAEYVEAIRLWGLHLRPLL